MLFTKTMLVVVSLKDAYLINYKYAVNSQPHAKQGKADCYKLVEGIHSADKHIQTYTVIANRISGILECHFLLINQFILCYR